MNEMETKMAKVSELGKLKERFLECAKAEMAKGAEFVNTSEMSEVIDMVKDLAEAEEKCMKACYYESICRAMCEEEKEMERYGYNSNRYASGRYAPKGHGNMTRMGHHMPYEMMGEDDMMTEYEELMMNRGRMGYSGDGQNGTNGRMNQTGPMMRSGYGDAYEKYREARRHYTETKSPSDKSEMDSHASRHLAEAEATMREIWKDADPTLRTQMKKELSSLLGEMN